jgi:hypothetical protein
LPNHASAGSSVESGSIRAERRRLNPEDLTGPAGIHATDIHRAARQRPQKNRPDTIQRSEERRIPPPGPTCLRILLYRIFSNGVRCHQGDRPQISLRLAAAQVHSAGVTLYRSIPGPRGFWSPRCRPADIAAGRSGCGPQRGSHPGHSS